MIVYEWIVEQVNKHGDIVDTYHFDTPEKMLEEILKPTDEGIHYEYGVVRDKIDKFESLESRQWAYIENGKLPELFDDGAIVPKKIKGQWNKAKTK